MIPALTTPVQGPLADLERRILEASVEVEHWFRGEWQEHTPPFYSSVDLRNSGFKLAPVDTNLFPGGFNNLNPQFMPLAVQATMTAIERICPDARRVLLIPENHTRNQFYLQNVARLRTIVRQAGLEVRIGTLIPEIKAPTEIAVPDNAPLVLEPLVRRGGRLGLADFDPCTILLNNDLSAGVPPILEGLQRAVGAAAAARRVGGAAQVAPLRALRAGGERVREAPRHRPVADQPVSRPLRRGQLQGKERGGVPRGQRRGAAAADPGEVPRVRHQGGALRRDQGRCRHLRHGHHDGEEPRRRARPEPRRRARRWRS